MYQGYKGIILSSKSINQSDFPCKVLLAIKIYSTSFIFFLYHGDHLLLRPWILQQGRKLSRSSGVLKYRIYITVLRFPVKL